MTAKRFKYICNTYRHYIQDVEEDGEYKKGYRGTYDEFDLEKLTNLLNELHEENQELRLQLNLCSDQRNEFHRGVIENVNRVGKLEKENEQLKGRLDELKTYDEEEFVEAEHINNIYKEKGFCGVIEYAKDKLQEYGAVKEVEKGLWVMVTGGWSDNEFWLHCLNNPISIFGMKHYRGYLRGGAFYYTEKPRGDVEIILRG